MEEIPHWQKYGDTCHCGQPLCSVKIGFMNGLTNARNGTDLLDRVTKIGFIAATALWMMGQISVNAAPPKPLKPPVHGNIPVAFLISNGAVIIDFCGPWEVFRDVMVPGRPDHPFQLYTVSESTAPIRAGG